MKFEKRDHYTFCEDLSYTTYSAKGIGKIFVKYDILPDSPKARCWLQIDAVSLPMYHHPAEIIQFEAIKLYKSFVQNKISSRHVVVKEKGMYRVYDIQSGASILLTLEAIGKLWRMV